MNQRISYDAYAFWEAMGVLLGIFLIFDGVEHSSNFKILLGIISIIGDGYYFYRNFTKKRLPREAHLLGELWGLSLGVYLLISGLISPQDTWSLVRVIAGVMSIIVDSWFLRRNI